MNINKAQIGVVMGSKSDWKIMQYSTKILKKFNIIYETKIISAHRTPDLLFEYAEQAVTKGLKIIIAGAGGAAHLPGMLASKTHLPILGVPIQSTTLLGQDSLLSIVQMPSGIPVATFAIGVPGAVNAALFACSIMSTYENDYKIKLKQYRQKNTQSILDTKLEINI